MSKIKLDKSRYHSEVHGEAPHGLAAYQDGLPFNHQGELVEAMITPELQTIVDKKLRKIAKLAAASGETQAKQPPAPPSPPAASDDDDETDTNTADDDDDDDDDGDVTDEVNFEQWLKDEVKYPWHIIAAAGKKRFHKHFKNAKELADFLVYDENLVGPEEVPTKLGKKDA